MQGIFRRRRDNRVKATTTDRVVRVVIIVLVALLSLSILLPFINIFALAFNDGKDAARRRLLLARLFTLVS